MTPNPDAVAGCLLGLAVGDAIGLPREGLSPRRGERLFPHLDRHQFVFRRGMCSDDTEHACMTAQALLRSGGEVERFTHSLAWRLRLWLLGLPAGVGLATLKSCVKLWFGFPPRRSGVFSAGNGPAMRSPILGVCLGSDPDRLRAFVRASTRMTHTDPKAECGALAVAWAVHRAGESRGRPAPAPAEFVAELGELLKDAPGAEQLGLSLEQLRDGLAGGRSVAEFAAGLGLSGGVTGYMYHTVPVALYAWLRHPDDYQSAVRAVVRCGGDTDTLAAITGSIVGARVGKGGIPAPWLSGVAEWPRSVLWVESLAARLAGGNWRHAPQSAQPLAVWGLPLRNAAFFGCVLLHAVRRLLPPY